MRERIIQKTYSDKAKEIEARRDEVRKNLQRAFSIEEISATHKAYSSSYFDDMLLGVENSENTQKAYLSYQKALKKHGFCENDFQYIPSCSICNDTGNDNGQVCKCVWDKYIKNLKAECELDKRAKFSFDDCNLDLVSDETQKAELSKFYALMQKYANRYPNVKNSTIVFSGNVGTGKTCIAGAIVRSIVEKGYCAKIFSAYEFVSLMLKVHTSPIAERNALLDDVLTADVILIDDLGTEPMLRNVTVEYLLLVIEERQNANKATIITTNLSEGDLLNRYGERVYSRLHHKQNAVQFSLHGKDLRLVK